MPVCRYAHPAVAHPPTNRRRQAVKLCQSFLAVKPPHTRCGTPLEPESSVQDSNPLLYQISANETELNCHARCVLAHGKGLRQCRRFEVTLLTSATLWPEALISAH